MEEAGLQEESERVAVLAVGLWQHPRWLAVAAAEVPEQMDCRVKVVPHLVFPQPLLAVTGEMVPVAVVGELSQ